MTEYAELLKADTGQSARSIHIVDDKSHEEWLSAQPDRTRGALKAQAFKPKAHMSAIIPGEQADEWTVVAGVADSAKLTSWCLAKLAETLPEGANRIELR